MQLNKKTKKNIKYNDSESLQSVMRRKAVGYNIEEVVEEYASIEDDMKLIKKKISLKYYPPDLNALQFLIERSGDEGGLAKMSDEELNNEIKVLLEKYNKITNKK